MTIIDKIHESITDTIGLKMIYRDYMGRNDEIDDYDFNNGPVAFCTQLTNGEVVNKNGRLCERINVAMSILDIGSENSSYENEEVIDACKRMLFKWILSLYMNGDFHVLSIGNSGREYEGDDAMVTGFTVIVTLEEKIGISQCDFVEQKEETEDGTGEGDTSDS